MINKSSHIATKYTSSKQLQNETKYKNNKLIQ